MNNNINRCEIVDWFLSYNKDNLKSVTKSIDIISEKYGCGVSTVRKILGSDVIEEAKLNPSHKQARVIKELSCGKNISMIARELGVSRQDIFTAKEMAKGKGLIPTGGR